MNAISALFLRLEVRYGIAFTRQWRDDLMTLVMDDWEQVLGHVLRNPRMVAFGLDNLSPDRPPKTATEFRDLCLRAPPVQEAIETTAIPSDPARVRLILQKIVHKRGRLSTVNWRDELLLRQARGYRLSRCQKAMIRNAISRGESEELDNTGDGD